MKRARRLWNLSRTNAGAIWSQRRCCAKLDAMTRALPSSLRLALGEYAARLRAVFGDRLAEVRLFGSFARGEANEDSDVDVLVLVDGLTDAEIGVAAGEVAPVIHKTGLPLAPLPMATERLAELRRLRRPLALDLDADGISV